MDPIRMHTKPAGSDKKLSLESAGTAGAADKIQADLARQMAESAARLSEAYGRSVEIAGKGMEMGFKLINDGGQRLLNALASKIAGASQPAPATDAYDIREGAPDAAASQPVIGNAIPVAPGNDVSISFSLSNDVPDIIKRVTVRLEPLVGERTGHPLDGTAIAVTPAEKEILPLDFEKFIIRGTVAAGTPPDRYSGLILVQGDEQFTIRVCIVVEAKAPH